MIAMRYLSLFSGIEAATVAWEPLGFEPVAFCEIDKFPSAVLAYHYPHVQNLGDITKVDWKEFLDKHGTVDLIVGGSPCQSFSIAAGANRTSLDGKSNLMLEYLRAVDAVKPKWIVWENVPGVLNTRDNAFRQLLATLAEIGYRDLTYRVLDAQFFGVAQRRRRVFVVGRFAGGGFCSAAVLFDSESVQGTDTANRDKRKTLVSRDYGNVGARGAVSLKTDHLSQNGTLESFEISPTLDVASQPPVVCITNDTSHAAIDGDLCGTLLAGGGSPAIVIFGYQTEPTLLERLRPETGADCAPTI